MADRFRFRFETRYRPVLLAWGVRPDNSYVDLTDDERMDAHFGFVTMETPLANVTGLEMSGDYHWWKAIGIRLSLSDGGLTFGSNTKRGVCLRFAEPVPSSRYLAKPHPGLTLTLEDPEGFASAVRSRAGLD